MGFFLVMASVGAGGPLWCTAKVSHCDDFSCRGGLMGVSGCGVRAQ